MPARVPLRLLAALLLAALLAAGACTSSGGGDAAGGAKPTVVVTTPVLGDVVRNALGDQARVEVLVPPGVDPRTYAMPAEQRARVPDASVVVVNGFGADPELGDTLLAVRARGHAVIEAASRLNPRPSTSAGTAAPTTASPDPHVWLDPDRMTQLARIVGDAVAPLPGVDRAEIQRRTDAYASQLAGADEAIQAALLPVPEGKRTLVTEGDELGYFAERYGLQVVATPVDGAEGVEGAPPGSQADRLEALAARMQTAAAKVILTPHTPPSTFTQELAQRVGGARVVSLDVSTLGPPGSATDSEVKLLKALGDELGRALAA